MKQGGNGAARIEPSVVADRYLVKHLLGRGASGAVFEVVDERTAKTLALKWLDVTDDRARTLALPMFEHEYHMLAELNHPSIVSVFDYGREPHGAYYTMEILTGKDLREQGKIDWREACAILRDVASALAILHSRRRVHGDLSTRNVRRTGEGGAKLIDFGTMAPMDVPKLVAGTPPFLPPEVLQLQSLDGRADLYSLGAVAYWMLTGRHAYPARRIDELNEIWQRPVFSPRDREPEVPEALSELVVELLRLDRMARPPNAAAVIERLCTIAELARREDDAAARAYLSMPSLVGRKESLDEARKALESKTTGAVLFVEGDPGVGRSRFLDACVLEAKLAGATVLRAGASVGAASDYGVARELSAQLVTELGDHALRAALPWRDLLAQVLGELGETKTGSAPERRFLQTALRDWVLALTRDRRLVFVVDDFDEIDEPSAAWLAALPHHGTRRGLSVIVSAKRAAAQPAVRLVRETARLVALTPLAEEDTESLLRSVFGDVDNVALVAHQIHELSEGNPRHTMELAAHVVERGLARYEAGSWTLPRVLERSDLPGASTLTRLSEVSEHGRELLEVLSLTDLARLNLEDYGRLLPSGPAQSYRSLTEVVAAGFLVQVGPRYRFVQPALAHAISQRIPPERRGGLHAHLATIKRGQNDQHGLAFHLFESGDARGAADVVRQCRKDRTLGFSPRAAELLEHLLGKSDDLGLPRSERISLSVALVGVCALLGDQVRFSRHAPALLEQLNRDSGLSDWNELAAEDVPETERLARAFERAQKRFDETPEEQRGLPGQKAFMQLCRVASSFSSMASVAMDAKPVVSLPSFRPFIALSPAIEVLDQSLTAVREFLTCRGLRAKSAAKSVVDRLLEPDRAGLDDSMARSLRFGMLYMLGAMDAFDGLPHATEHVAEFDDVPGYRGNAWRVRRVAHLMQGDFEAAKQCHRRAELFELLDGQKQAFPGTVVRIEAFAHWMVGDIAGLKETTERIAELAAQMPGWQNTLSLARSHLCRLQGDGRGALELISPALATSSPGADPDWPLVAAAHVAALTALERYDEASSVGLDYYTIAKRKELTPPARCLVKPLCEALLGSGRLEAARELADDGIRELEAEGVRGLWLGSFYEARALVAIFMSDSEGFQLNAARCGAEYRRGRNSTLIRNYERLMRTASRQELRVSDELQRAADFTQQKSPSVSSIQSETFVSRLAACCDFAERSRCVLTLLMEQTGADAGFLFGMRLDGLSPLSVLPEDTVPPETLRAVLEEQVKALTDIEEQTISVFTDLASTETAHEALDPISFLSSSLHPLPLIVRDGQHSRLAGMAALRSRNPCLLSADAIDVLARSLLDNDHAGLEACPVVSA